MGKQIREAEKGERERSSAPFFSIPYSAFSASFRLTLFHILPSDVMISKAEDVFVSRVQ